MSPQILPTTRVLLIGFAVLTALATNQLYVLSGRTEDLFAWTVLPPLTAAMMGAGYAAGFVMVLLALRSEPWVHVRLVVLTVLVFTVLTLTATLLHLDRFHLDASGSIARAAGWFWLVVYLVAPVAMLGVLVSEERVPRAAVAVVRPMPLWLRVTALVQGIALVAIGAVMFLAPGAAARVWPWPITPLTSRVLAAWLVALAVGLLLTVRAYDVGYARLTAVPYALFGLLVGVALVRYSSTVDWSRASAWVLVTSAVVVVVTGVSAAAVERSSRPTADRL